MNLQNPQFLTVNTEIVTNYFTLREGNDVSKKWLAKIKLWLNEYLKEFRCTLKQLFSQITLKDYSETHHSELTILENSYHRNGIDEEALPLSRSF